MSEEQKLQKMTDWASLFLEPGETIRAAAWGPWSELAFLLGVGSGRIAAVTGRHLYVFESPLWGRMSRPRGGGEAPHRVGADEAERVGPAHRGRADGRPSPSPGPGKPGRGLRMQLQRYRPRTSAVWADALFASVLQRSDEPSAGQVREAVAAAMRAYGGRGCAERVAQEFGDHPETAVARMRWARGVVGKLLAAPGPAQDGCRRQPVLRVPGLGRRRLVRT